VRPGQSPDDVTWRPARPYTTREVNVTDAPETPDKPSAPPSRANAGLRSHWVLILAVAGAGAAALYGRAPAARSEAPKPVASAEARRAPASSMQPGESAKTALSGKVLERIDVEKYTYLRLDTGAGSPETWAAVTSAKVNVGDDVRVVDAELMTGFVSATLKRTFEKIYFGALDDGSRAAQSSAARDPIAALGADPHAGVPGAPPLGAKGMAAGADPHAGVPGAPPLGAAAANPHGGSEAGATVNDVAPGSVARAKGSAGRTVAELHSQRGSLKDKTVRVRGVVVKSVSGVLGRTFLHVRDGSGNAGKHDNDLVVTTTRAPAVGEQVLLEGKVTTDKDFGAGYSYPVLLEDAQLVSE